MKWTINQTTRQRFDQTEKAPTYEAILHLESDSDSTTITLSDLQAFITDALAKGIPDTAILGSPFDMPVRWS